MKKRVVVLFLTLSIGAASVLLTSCDLPKLPKREKAVQKEEKLGQSIVFSVPGIGTGDAPVSLDAYQGQVVLLDFWATWSDACRADLPTLSQLYSDYRERGFTVVGLVMDEPVDEKVVAFIERQGLAYPNGEAAPLLRQPPFDSLRVIPTRYLLNRDHRLSGKPIPGIGSEQELRTRIEALLGN